MKSSIIASCRVSLACLSLVASSLMMPTIGAAQGEQSAAVTPTTNFSLRLVTPLHWSEAYTGQTVHLKHLFVGKSNNDGHGHRIEVYNQDGTTLVQTLTLPHTPNKMYPFGAGSVIVSGKSYSDQWYTHYSVISPVDPNHLETTTFRVSTTNLPIAYMIDEIAGIPGEIYLTETGDAAILRQTRDRGIETFSDNVSGPAQMVLAGDTLWAIESRAAGLGDETVLAINTRTGVRQDIFPNRRGAGITEIIALNDGQTAAVNEALTGKVTLIDKISHKEISSAQVSSDVRGLVQYGHCILAVSALSQNIDFVDVKDRMNPTVIATWDLRNAGGGEILRRPSSIQVDQSTGRIFLRSTWTCPTCNPNSQSSVMTAFDTEGSVMKQCLLAP